MTVPIKDIAVEMRGLTKYFGERAAVNGIDLAVPAGELFGFLGPNGAGKTTTLKMLMGLIQPSAGSAALCGFDVVNDPMRAKMVAGYVPDHAALYEKLSGREMVGFVASMFRVPQDTQAAKTDALLERFGLADDADALVQSYSRGMRQKLALCAALVHEPQILFLDEPTVGLDPAGSHQLKDVLRNLCAAGRTVFLNTHVLEVAELLCDRVGIVVGGRLVALGSPSELQTASGASSLESAFLAITDGSP